MKFIHMADMHFDAPFTILNIQNNLSTNRDKKDTLNQGIFFLKLDSRG